METKVNAYVQGINQGLTHANGSYDSHELGEINAEELIEVLKKIQHFEMPEAGSDDDLCPPEITVQGPAGDFMFDPWDGELHEVDAGGHLAPRGIVAVPESLVSTGLGVFEL